MSKRTPGLERRKHDQYDTPAKATTELLKHLLPGTRFIEPCAGKGDLIRHLQAAGHICTAATDIDKTRWPEKHGHLELPRLVQVNAEECDFSGVEGSCFITNPPWTRALLYPIIRNLSAQRPTWLLFDSDWACNEEAAGLLDICERIVPQGRVNWIEGTKHQGMDNCSWYRFDATHSGGPRWFNRRARRQRRANE